MNQLTIFGEAEQVAQSHIDYVKSQPDPHPDSPVVVGYGGGKNSTALLILCQKLDIKVDLILFADTGGEIPQTYEYIEMFSEWLIEHGMPPITVVKRQEVSSSANRKVWQEAKNNFYFGINAGFSKQLIRWLLWWIGVTGSKYNTLEENCLITNTLPSKVYGSGQCSVAWKIEPQNKFVDHWTPASEAWDKGLKVRKLIGYHTKEIGRLIDKKTGQLRSLEDNKYEYDYLLIKHGLDDIACQSLIASVGLTVPPKSNCFFCPNRKIREILELSEELRARAELIEQVANDGIHHRSNTNVKGLGRKFAWAELGKLTPLEQALIETTQESKQCHCVDE